MAPVLTDAPAPGVFAERLTVRKPIQTPWGMLAAEGRIEVGKDNVRDIFVCDNGLVFVTMVPHRDGKVMRIILPGAQWDHAVQWVETIEEQPTGEPELPHTAELPPAEPEATTEAGPEPTGEEDARPPSPPPGAEPDPGLTAAGLAYEAAAKPARKRRGR
jgi:hypothetical protein